MRDVDPQCRFDPEQSPETVWQNVTFSAGQRLVYAFDRLNPVRLECTHKSGSLRDDDVQALGNAPQALTGFSATALAPDSGQELVTYTLQLAALNSDTRSQVAHILGGSNSLGRSALEILKHLYSLTGPDLWVTTRASAAFPAHGLSPEAFAHHVTLPGELQEGMLADRPALGEYLQAPENLGRQFSVERILPDRLLRMEATIFPELNGARFAVYDCDPNSIRTAQREGTFFRRGTLPDTANTSEIEQDLKQMVSSALAQFEATGRVEFSKPAHKSAQAASLSTNQVELTTKATVTIEVADDGLRLLVSSGPLDQHTLTSNRHTVCSWFFETPNPEIRERTCRYVSTLALKLTQEYNPSLVRQAFEDLLNNFGFPVVESAPVSALLNPALAQHLSSQPDQILIDTPETLYARVQDLTRLLKGEQRFSVILPHARKAVEDGYSQSDLQLFPKMDISVQGPSHGPVRIELKNGLHQELHATLGSKVVTPTAEVFSDSPEKQVLAEVCRAFARQIQNGDPSSSGMASLVTLLGKLQEADPVGTRVKQRGWGAIPDGNDLVGHKLIHSLASPLIGHYVSESGMILTDAFVLSPSPGECLFHIGERDQDYRLSIFALGDSVCEIRITPRRKNRDSGGRILDMAKSRGYPCQLPLTSEQDTRDTLNTLKKVVELFCDLVEPVCVAGEPVRRSKFGSSRLRRLLSRISAESSEL